jgi:hypothetical protein
MMNPRNHKRNRSGRVERAVLRVVLVVGLAAAGVLWYVTRGAGENVSASMSGLIGVAVVGGVTGFGRARARRRWEAAWDDYATGEVGEARPFRRSGFPA